MLMLFTPSVISSIGIRRGKEDQNPNPNYQAKRDEGRTRKLGEGEISNSGKLLFVAEFAGSAAGGFY